MPSRHPSIFYSSLPHLSTIINLQPDSEPWCAGYAPSRGRRCQASTNAHGRRCAMDILDEATEDLRAGDSIDDLLKELAPYVLCRRFHQNQASDLARRWRKQVSSFVESRRSSPTQRTVQNNTGIRRQVPRRQTSEEQFEVRLREMKQRIEELLWIEDFDGLPATSLRSQVLNDARHMIRTIGAINNSPTTPTDNIAQPRGDFITPVETPIRSLSDSTRREISRNSASSRERLATSSEPSSLRSEATTTMPPTSDSAPQAVNTQRSTHSTESATRKARVSRRPAEGECGICLCSLQEPQSYGTDDEEEEEDDEGDEETDEEEDEGHDDSDDSGDEQGYYSDDDEPEVEVEEDGLVWCKAQCGVNYHRECIEKWLRSGHYDSCPTCRKTWRY